MKQVLVFACDSCSYMDADEKDMLAHEEQHARDRAERARREATGQLTIGQIIQKCKQLPNLSMVVSCPDDAKYDGGFPSDIDSYRGYYDELAIDVSRKDAMSLEAFLKEMERSLRRSYSGYKGGEYDMYEDTFVWLAEYGVNTGIAIRDVRLSDGEETILLEAVRLHKEW